MAKGMKDSTKGQGGSKAGSRDKGHGGGREGDQGMGSLKDTGEIKRDKGMGSQERDAGEFKNAGRTGGRHGPKLAKDLPKKGCFPKAAALCLPLIIVAAYWSFNF